MFTALPITAVYTADQALKNVYSITFMKPDGTGDRAVFPSYKAALAWLKLQSAFDFQWLQLHNSWTDIVANNYLDAVQHCNSRIKKGYKP